MSEFEDKDNSESFVEVTMSRSNDEEEAPPATSAANNDNVTEAVNVSSYEEDNSEGDSSQVCIIFFIYFLGFVQDIVELWLCVIIYYVLDVEWLERRFR